PGPSRETRGLRVEVEQARARRRFAAREESERRLRDAPGPLEGLAPMMMIVGEAAADAQHVSSIRFLDRAPHQVLEGAASSKRGARPTLGLETADDLAEISGDVAHGAWEMVSGDGRGGGGDPEPPAWRGSRPRFAAPRTRGNRQDTGRPRASPARGQGDPPAPRRCARQARCPPAGCHRGKWWA